MTDRDRLIELLSGKSIDTVADVEYVADYLLANGVIVPKQGEWIQTKEPLGWQDIDCVECSICHENWICDEDNDFEFYKEFWKYCPNCGAKMDLKELGK